MSNYKNYTQEVILSDPYTLTGSAVEIGTEINTIGIRRLVLFVGIDINDSANVRIVPYFRLTTGGTNYFQPLQIAGTTETKVQDNYYEIDTDADQYQTIEIELDGSIPYVKLAALAGTAGATPGLITGITVIKHGG